MTRYEVAVETPVAFAATDANAPFSVASQMVIVCNGVSYVWHDQRHTTPEALHPVVSVMVGDAQDYANEQLTVTRLLSALSYVLDHRFAEVVTSAAGFKGEFDRPILGQPGLPASIIVRAPASVVVQDDDRLRLVLALHREGRAATSPFYRFLALYNGLDAAFDNKERERDIYIDAELIEEPAPDGGWAKYLADAMRNAIAHAVRGPGKAVLDPDAPSDRAALRRSADGVVKLLRSRVAERWPGAITVEWGDPTR